MKKIHKLYYSFKYYGLYYVCLKIGDRFLDTENAMSYLYNKCKRINPSQYGEELIKIYAIKTGVKLNLKHPRTFNEKIQWMKINDISKIKTNLADKYLVREWIKEKIGEQYLIPILGVWDKFEEINLKDLPDSFVLKTNHGSGWNVVIKGKDKVDWSIIQKKFNYWLSMDFAFIGGFEMQYHDISPKIIAEEYIENGNGNLYDYKIHCFNGKPEYIQVIGDRDLNAHEAREAFYDTEWILQPFTYTYPRYIAEKQKPAKLREMLQIASVLSKGFIYVRVDLYELDNGNIKFGEMTFTPTSGFDQWKPLETDEILGGKINLP